MTGKKPPGRRNPEKVNSPLKTLGTKNALQKVQRILCKNRESNKIKTHFGPGGRKEGKKRKKGVWETRLIEKGKIRSEKKNCRWRRR